MKKLILVMATLLCSLMASAWTVYFQNTAGWNGVKIWTWPDAVAGNWDDRPAMSPVDGTTDIYSYSGIGSPTGLKFTAGIGDGATGDLSFTDGWLYDANGAVGEYEGGGDNPDPGPDPVEELPIADVKDIPAGIETGITKGTPTGKTYHLVGDGGMDSEFTWNAEYGCYAIIYDMGNPSWFKINDGTWDVNYGSGSVVNYGNTKIYSGGGNCTAGDIKNKKVLMFFSPSDLKIYVPTNEQVKAAMDIPVEPEVIRVCSDDLGWGEEAPAMSYDEATGAWTYRIASVAAGSMFKLWSNKYAYDNGYMYLTPETSLTCVEVVDGGTDHGNIRFKADCTDVKFTYKDGKLSIEGKEETVPVIPTDKVAICGSTYGWNDGTALTYDATLGGYILKADFTNGEQIKFKLNGSWVESLNLTAEAQTFFKQVDNNWVAQDNYTDITLVFKLGTTPTLDVKAAGQPTDITGGKYIFGDKLYLHYRNDADLTKPFEKAEIAFEKWDAETGEGLELFVYRFRANSRDVAFYLSNEKGEIIDGAQEMAAEHFYTYITPGVADEEHYNHFTDLVLGEDYRVIVKADAKAEGQDYHRSFIGIFPTITDYPWGRTPEGLRLHSNLANGTWPGVGEILGLNVSEGPDFLYNENSKIWYVDFTLGAAGELNNGQGQGWEFTLTDKFGINWYKKDLEIVPGDWQDGAMDLQTANNDMNFYIKEEAALAAGLEPGKECRMQIRHNEATGKWQVRLIEKPVFNGDLYISSSDINADATPVMMQKANDVKGQPIEGMYVYTMKYTAGNGFRVSTADGDAFTDHQLTMAVNGESAAAAELATPYSYHDQNNEAADAWTVAGDPQMISVVVNYNTGTLRVYSPSVEITFENRRVLKMPGKFNAEERGVDVADVTNKVNGATDRDPVVFTRMNYITADVVVTHRYFDDECTFTVDGLTINGLPVGNMEGITVRGSENIAELTNHLSYLPYAGHLELGDGDPAAHYDIVLSYTVTRGDLAKTGVAKTSYVPNFQPYFVRPRPVTDADQSLKVKKGYVGDDFKALAVRTVKFAGNTFDGVYHDYKGDGDPDNARVAVYPGFRVQTDAEQPEGHHIPMGADWASTAGNADYYLESYTKGGDMDWSTAALMEGKLPVFVNTNCTSVDENPAVTYEIYAHYPLYSINGGVRVPASEHDLGFESGDQNRAAARAAVDGAKVSTIVQFRTYNDPEFDQETTGVESVAADMTADGDAEYFNLQGVRVAAPEKGCIYIVRQGNKVAKIRF